MSNYNPAELTVIMGSRALQDGQLVFAGAGLPLLSAIHAQKMHAPSLSILFEVGGVAPRITSLPRSTNEARSVRRSVATPATIDMMLYLQRGFVDVGFSGRRTDRPSRKHQQQLHWNPGKTQGTTAGKWWGKRYRQLGESGLHHQLS